MRGGRGEGGGREGGGREEGGREGGSPLIVGVSAVAPAAAETVSSRYRVTLVFLVSFSPLFSSPLLSSPPPSEIHFQSEDQHPPVKAFPSSQATSPAHEKFVRA